MTRSTKKRTYYTAAALLVLSVIGAAVVSLWPAPTGSIVLSGDLSLHSRQLAYRQITPSAADSDRVNLRLTYQLSSDPNESLWLDATLPARLDAGTYRFDGDALSMRVQRYRNGRARTTRYSGNGVLIVTDYVSDDGDRDRVSGVIEFTATATAADGDYRQTLARAEFRDVRR